MHEYLLVILVLEIQVFLCLYAVLSLLVGVMCLC